MKSILVIGIDDNYGGTEAVIMNYYRHFSDALHCDFLCNVKKPAYEDELLKKGSKIYKITPRHEDPRKNKRELEKFFQSHAKDYVAIWYNANSLANIDYLKIARKYGIKKRIIHAHNSSIHGNLLRSVLHYIHKKTIHRYATDFWACSSTAADFFYNRQVRKSYSFKIIPNAIDLKKFEFSQVARDAKRKELQIPDDVVALCNVGRLCYQKNQEFLIELMHTLKNDKKYVLYLVGDGEDRPVLEQKIKEYGLDGKVVLLGSRNDVPELLSAFDVFLFPSRYEGLGIVQLESAASGLPVFSSKPAVDALVGMVEPSELNITSVKDDATEFFKRINAFKQLDRKEQSSSNILKLRKLGFDIAKAAKQIETSF